LAQKIGVSTSTAQKICPYVLSLFPYKIQLLAVVGAWSNRTFRFANEYGKLLEGNSGELNIKLFSNETLFNLDAYINRLFLEFLVVASLDRQIIPYEQRHNNYVPSTFIENTFLYLQTS
jgi:hypothetical protein